MSVGSTVGQTKFFGASGRHFDLKIGGGWGGVGFEQVIALLSARCSEGNVSALQYQSVKIFFLLQAHNRWIISNWNATALKRLRFHRWLWSVWINYCRSHIYLRDGWPDQNCIFKVKLKSLTICVPYSRNRLVFEMFKDGFTWSKNKARVKASQVDFPREQIWSFKQVEAFCEYAKLLWNMSQKFSELLFNTHRSDRNFVATQFS